MSLAIVIDGASASVFGQLIPAGVTVVNTPRSASRRRTSLRTKEREVQAALEAVDRAGALALTRPATTLHRVARTVGCPSVLLPGDRDSAGWVISMASAVRAAEPDSARRVIEVLAGGPSSITGAPTRAWGATQLSVPALRPATLARRALTSWRPCGWCGRGGADGAACPVCGQCGQTRQGDA